MGETILTYRYRLKNKHDRHLAKIARAVNQVWNFCNATQMETVRRRDKWTNWAMLSGLMKGVSGVLPISSSSAIQVCRKYDASRRTSNRAWLRFRSYKNLGWIPLRGDAIRVDGNGFRYFGKKYQPMHRREIPDNAKIVGSSFSQDSRGNWYLNLGLKLTPKGTNSSNRVLGVDLGLKDLAVTSDGDVVPAPKLYRQSEQAIGSLQRARKTKRARAIHRKVKNRRKDFLHKAANSIVSEYGTIFVGDVSPSKLAQTTMAKSVNDAAWATFKNMLRYKSVMNGGRMVEVNESYTSQTCSHCGALPPERPRGIAGLGIREWQCGQCKTVHHRDVNAAKNILRIGLDTLAEGTAARASGAVEEMFNE